MRLRCVSAPENKMFREGNLYDAELVSEGRQLRVTDDLGHTRIISSGLLRFSVSHTDQSSVMLDSANYARFKLCDCCRDDLRIKAEELRDVKYHALTRFYQEPPKEKTVEQVRSHGADHRGYKFGRQLDPRWSQEQVDAYLEGFHALEPGTLKQYD